MALPMFRQRHLRVSVWRGLLLVSSTTCVAFVIFALLLSQAACRKPAAEGVRPRGAPLIVYCSVDEGFARGILDTFSERTGIECSVVFDSEAGKTTGLIQRIIHEAKAGRPRADVLWSSELFNTMRLAQMGLLESYDSPAAADIPSRYRDPKHRWTALAARARVLAFDPARVRKDDAPGRWEQLADPEYAGRTAIANPVFGTTRGHVAAMFALWGKQRARRFLEGLHAGGAVVTDGNSAAVRAVMSGRADFAATDTDDVWVAQRAGASLDFVYPDMGDGGTLLVPCSVAIIAHPDDDGESGPAGNRAYARKLVDFLVSAEVERMLAKSDSRNLPVRDWLLDELGMVRPAETKVAFSAVAEAVDEAVAAARETLIR